MVKPGTFWILTELDRGVGPFAILSITINAMICGGVGVVECHGPAPHSFWLPDTDILYRNSYSVQFCTTPEAMFCMRRNAKLRFFLNMARGHCL